MTLATTERPWTCRLLSGDINAGTPAEIRRLEVVATIVGGIAEFCTDPAICL